jgi:hypothetical protein
MRTIITNSLLVIAILLFTNTFAQPQNGNKKGICDEMMKCSYIFEGKIISMHSYKTKEDEDKYRGYSSYIIEVKKVVKGNIHRGTINVLLPFGISKDGNPVVPGEGLYCCYTDSPVKDSSVVNSNSKSLEYVCGDSMSNGELKKDNNDNLILYFSSISDFYNYISANYGVKIEDK